MTIHLKTIHVVFLLCGLAVFSGIQYANAGNTGLASSASRAQKGTSQNQMNAGATNAQSNQIAPSSGSSGAISKAPNTGKGESGNAQTLRPTQNGTASSDSVAVAQTSDGSKIAALEKRVAELEQLISYDGKTVTISSPGSGTIRIDSKGKLELKSANDLTIASTKKLTLKSDAAMSVKGESETTIDSSGVLNIKGSIVRFNNGSAPAARITDKVVVPKNGGTGTIVGGTPNVLLP